MPELEVVDKERSAKKIWGLVDVKTRGPKPSHALDDVIVAAIQIADEVGMDALSMRELASRLGLTKMAMYRYVTSKSELVALMVEAAVGNPPRLGRKGWRNGLRSWALHQRDTWRRHPWLPSASDWQPVDDGGDRLLGPNELSHIEVALETLDGTGLSPREALECVFLVSAYNRSSLAALPSRLLPWDARSSVASTVGGVIRAGNEERFPMLERLARNPGRQSMYDFGLDRVLDGIEKLLTERR